MRETGKSSNCKDSAKEKFYKKERYLIKSAVFLILTRESNGKTEVLLQRRFNTGYMDGKYDTACSGHLEAGEDLASALIRETKEELGIQVNREDLKFVALLHPYKDGYINIFFKTDKFTGTPQIMEPNKCDDIQWFDLDNLPENTIERYIKVMKRMNEEPFYEECN